MTASFIPRHLNRLLDANIVSPANRQVLIYNSAISKWDNGLLSIDDLNDAVISSPVTGQVLRHNGTNWANAQLAHSDLSGIGNPNPHGTTFVQTNITISGVIDIDNNSAVVNIIDILQSRTDLSGTIPSSGYFKSSLNAPSASSSAIVNLVSELETLGASINYTGQQYPFSSSYRHKGSGTVGYGCGSISRTFNESTGIITQAWGNYSESENLSSGTITEAIGYFSDIENSVNGTITEAVGYQSSIFQGADGVGGVKIPTAYGYRAFTPQQVGAGTMGRIGTYYGLYVDGNPSGAPRSSLDNFYGLYIKGVNGATTNNYSIYSDSGLNYFSGKVGIGTLPSANEYRLIIGGTFSGSGDQSPIYCNATFSGSGNAFGLGMFPVITAAKAFVWAVYGSIKVDGAITVTNAAGLEYTVYTQNGATITNATAVNAVIGRWYSGTTMTTAKVINATWGGSAATVTNAFTGVLQLPSGSTKNYGLFISTSAESAAPAGSYAIYADNYNSYFGANLSLGAVSFGGSANRVLGIANGTAPTTSPADMFQLYSADQVAGNACPFVRTENGAIIKLYQETGVADPTGGTTIDTEARTAISALLTRLESIGLLVAA